MFEAHCVHLIVQLQGCSILLKLSCTCAQQCSLSVSQYMWEPGIDPADLQQLYCVKIACSVCGLQLRQTTTPSMKPECECIQTDIHTSACSGLHREQTIYDKRTE